MNDKDRELTGYIKAKLEQNEQEHGEIKADIKEIKTAVINLKVSSAKGGILGGAITTGLAFLGLWVKSQFK